METIIELGFILLILVFWLLILYLANRLLISKLAEKVISDGGAKNNHFLSWLAWTGINIFGAWIGLYIGVYISGLITSIICEFRNIDERICSSMFDPQWEILLLIFWGLIFFYVQHVVINKLLDVSHRWVLLSTAAWTISILIITTIDPAFLIEREGHINILKSGFIGLSIGLSQFHILKTAFRYSWLWIITTIAGWIIIDLLHIIQIPYPLGLSLCFIMTASFSGIALPTLIKNRWEEVA